MNQFRNPSFYQTDVTLYKDTHITERLNFQFRFEFYNLFNHANFGDVSNDLSAGNFGVVTCPNAAEMVADRRQDHLLVEGWSKCARHSGETLDRIDRSRVFLRTAR